MTEQNKFWRKVGAWSLYSLIASASPMLILLAISAWKIQSNVWFVFSMFAVITIVVLGHELWAYLTKRKTISTMTGDLIRANKPLGYTIVGLFVWAMVSLGVHFVAYGLR